MNTDKPNRIVFNTDAMPERDRFPAFCEEVIRRYTGLDIKKRDESIFRGTIELQRIGEIDFGVFATSAANFDRSAHLVRDGDDGLIFMLSQNGISCQTQREDNRIIENGNGVICDCGYAGGLHMVTDSTFWSLKVPRNRITSLLPHANRLAGAKLDNDPMARRLLFGHLSGTYNVDLSGGGPAVHLYDTHIVDLLALGLGAERDTRELVELRGVGVIRRAAILYEIKNSFGDPNLSATAIASRLGITPRCVHLLLEQSGHTFTQHVLQMRLEKAAKLLGDDKHHNRRIAEIALEVGFTDLSHFNRAFRRHFGDTPSGVRANSAKRRSSR
jgi:AraC-like DNA-binding protein